MFDLSSKVIYSRILTLDDVIHKGATLVEPISVAQRRHPAFVLDLSGEDLPHHLYHEGPVELGGVLKSEWGNAAVFGWNALHAFFSEDANFTCQDIIGTVSRVDQYLQHPPGPPYLVPKVTKDEDVIAFDFRQVPDEFVCRSVDDLYFGSPIEPLNWGMWLLHCIPSAADYIASGQQGRFGCWFKLEWQRKLLSFMGVDDRNLVQIDEWKTYAVERLTFRSYPNIDLYVGQRDRSIFTDIAQRCLDVSEAPRASRIFVSRRTRSAPGGARRLANEAELADALQSIGFTIVEPELLKFEDQVALFASATTIVGLGGAGLFNVVFAKSGTKIVTIEASNAFVHGHANLFASLDLDYAVIFGERDKLDNRSPHHGWRIDVASAVAKILQFI